LFCDEPRILATRLERNCRTETKFSPLCRIRGKEEKEEEEVMMMKNLREVWMC
jgi:hypothetical protein